MFLAQKRESYTRVCQVGVIQGYEHDSAAEFIDTSRKMSLGKWGSAESYNME